METNLQKYLAFVKTAELGSFTGAAEKLHYSQSGISRMIADLEGEWKLTLLERSKNGVVLTSDGLKLLPYAKRLCDEYDKMQMQIDDLRGLEKGVIRIGTFSSAATHWLPKIIRKFQQDYPGIDYELYLRDYTEIEAWIESGRVDCGFLRLPTHPSFETIHLHRDQLMVILPEGHPYAAADCFPMAELEREPFMLLEKGSRTEITDIFDRNGLTPQVHFTTWDDYAVMAMVEHGLGISIVPELILKGLPYRIVAKPLEIPAFRDTGFVIKDKRTASVAVRRFMDYLDYRNDET